MRGRFAGGRIAVGIAAVRVGISRSRGLFRHQSRRRRLDGDLILRRRFDRLRQTPGDAFEIGVLVDRQRTIVNLAFDRGSFTTLP